MVEKENPHSRRGRPPQFDRSDVVGAAIDAFMAKGFEATTLSDLESATGVDRSTLYNSFGGKSGLYHEATQRYVTDAEHNLFRPLLEGGEDGIADIVEFLDVLRSVLTTPEVSPGCLIVNDMAAVADPEAAARYRDLLHAGLEAALSRAARSGTTEPDRVSDRADLLSATVIGINLISRHTGDPTQVAPLIDAALTEVESWRVSS